MIRNVKEKMVAAKIRSECRRVEEEDEGKFVFFNSLMLKVRENSKEPVTCEFEVTTKTTGPRSTNNFNFHI